MAVAVNPYYRVSAIESEKQKLLANPHLVANVVADNLAEFFPGTAKPRAGLQQANRLTTLQSGIDPDHPLYSLPEEAYSAVTEALADPELKGYNANQIIGTITNDHLMGESRIRPGQPRVFDAFRHIRAKEAGIFGGPTFAKPRLYDEWLAAQRASEDQYLEKEGWLPTAEQISNAMATGLGIGTVASLAAGPLAPGVAPAAAATAALTMIPFEVGFHAAGKWLHGTEWYRAKADSPYGVDKLKRGAAELAVTGIGGVGLERGVTKSLALVTNMVTRAGKAEEALKQAQAKVANAPDPDNLIDLGSKTKVWDRTSAGAATALDNSVRLKYGDVYDQIKAMQDGEMGLAGDLTRPLASPAATESVPSLVAGYPLPLEAEKSMASLREMAETEAEFAQGSRARIYDYGSTEKMDPWDVAEPLPPAREAFSLLSDEAAEEALRLADEGVSIADATLNAIKGQTAIEKSVLMEQEGPAQIKLWEARQAQLKAQQAVREKHTPAILAPDIMHEGRLKELRRVGFPEEELGKMTHDESLVALEDFKQFQRRIEDTPEVTHPHTLGLMSALSAGTVSIASLLYSDDANAGMLTAAAELAMKAGKKLISDEVGKPITFYHGTEQARAFKDFSTSVDFAGRPSSRGRGIVSFTTDPEYASRYAGMSGDAEQVASDAARFAQYKPNSRPRVIPAYLEANNVFDYKNPDHVNVLAKSYAKSGEELRQLRVAKGYFDEPTATKMMYEELEQGIGRVKEGDWGHIEGNVKYLQSQGFDAVKTFEKGVEHTHVISPDQIIPKYDTDKIGTYGILPLVGAGIASAFSPDEAEAGMLGAVAKAAAPFIEKQIAKGTPIETMIEAFDKAGYRFRSVDPANPFTAIPPAEGLNLASAATEELGGLGKVVARTKHFVRGLERVMTAQKALIFYKEPYSPHVELGSRQAAWQWNIKENSKVLLNILKEVPNAVKSARYAQKEVESAMAPLAETYGADVITLSAVDQRLEVLGLILEKGGLNTAAKDTASSEVAKLTAMKEELTPRLEKYQQEWASVVQPLAKKYPTVRMFLAAEDTAEHTIYPWLNGMLSFQEKVGVARVKSMNKYYGSRMEAIGEDIIKERPYMQHSWHPSWDETKVARRLNDLNMTELADAIPYGRFYSRVQHSMPMMPEMTYSQVRYINDIEKRIQVAQFLDKKNPNGWYNHAFNPDGVVQLNPALREFWQDMMDKLAPAPTTTGTQWANRYSMLEMNRLIGWSPSTAFKHLFKQIGTMSTLGVRDTLKTMPSAVLGATRNWVSNNLSVEIQKELGLHKMLQQSKVIDDFAAAVGGRNKLQNIMQDLDIRQYGQSVPDELLQKLTTHSGGLVGAVESFDRYNTILASMLMAHKNGLTGTQALYGIYDTVLKNNFVGGVMNASWMKSPFVRAMMMFQTTPFKIAERRLIQAYKTNQSVGKAYDIIPGGTVLEKLQTLAGVKTYIKQGEKEFKYGMIKDALFSEKDAFGTPYTKQLMKEILMAGVVVGGGAAVLGVDLNPQVGHLPFLKYNSQDPVIAVSPVISAAFKTVADRSRASKRGDEPDFFITNYVNNWLGKETFMPLVAHKMARISNNDIPALYQDSGLQYLFSVPSVKKTNQ